MEPLTCPLVKSMFVGLTALEFATLHGVLLGSLVEIPADTPISGTVRVRDSSEPP